MSKSDYCWLSCLVFNEFTQMSDHFVVVWQITRAFVILMLFASVECKRICVCVRSCVHGKMTLKALLEWCWTMYTLLELTSKRELEFCSVVAQFRSFVYILLLILVAEWHQYRWLLSNFGVTENVKSSAVHRLHSRYNWCQKLLAWYVIW